MKQLFALALYAWPLTMLAGIVLLFVIAVMVALWVANRKGKSLWAWGLGAALAVYLLAFWDLVPTLLVHRYHCEKEAGFWVYKTLEQWKAENPGVLETLVTNKALVPTIREGNQDSWAHTYTLNQRIKKVSKHDGPLFLHRWRREGEWIDSEKNEMLARFVDFYTSHERRQAGWVGWKFWLATKHCPGYEEKAAQFNTSIGYLKGVEK